MCVRFVVVQIGIVLELDSLGCNIDTCQSNNDNDTRILHDTLYVFHTTIYVVGIDDDVGHSMTLAWSDRAFGLPSALFDSRPHVLCSI